MIEKSYTEEEIAEIVRSHGLPRYPKLALYRGDVQYMHGNILVVPVGRYLCSLSPNEPFPDIKWRRLIQVRQAKLGRTNSGRSYIVKKSTYD